MKIKNLLSIITTTSQKAYIQTILLVVLLFSSTIWLNQKRTSNPYYFDEVSWICNSRVTIEAQNGRWSSNIWTEDKVQTLNPQLYKFVLGSWIHLKFGDEGFAAFNCPDWGSLMWVDHLSSLTPLQQNVLFWARIPSLVFAIITLGLFFLISRIIFSYWLSIMTVLTLLLTPLFQQSINRSMPDSFLIAVLLLSILLLLQKYKTSTGFYALRVTVGIGILSGILVSIKTYGLNVWLFYVALSMADVMKATIKHRAIYTNQLKQVGNLCISACFLLTTIFFLNPLFWQSPIRLFGWFGEWREFQSYLQSLPQNYSIILTSPQDRAWELTRAFMYPGVWSSFAYIPFFSLIITCIALYSIVKNKWSFSSRFLLLWNIVFFSLALIYIPFKFERYYLPLLPGFLLLQWSGIVVISRSFNQLARRFWQNRL